MGNYIPSPNIIKRLADYFKVSVAWLGGYNQLPENTIADRLYKAQRLHGDTVITAAKKINISNRTLRSYLKKERIPLAKNRQKMEKYLSILNHQDPPN